MQLIVSVQPLLFICAMLRFLKWTVIVLLLGFLAFKLGSRAFRAHIQTTYTENIKQGPFDALIIPGIPYDTLEPSDMLKARMYWAKKLLNEGAAKNLIFSGDAVHTPYIEGCCMKTMADSMGLPPQHTFAETKALHGTENVDYGLALAKEKGWQKVAVATDPFQTFYLKEYEKKNAVLYLPFEVDCMKTFRQPLPVIDASEARVNNFIPLKDRK